ncbi:electron transport complex subunit RsxC [Photobacterium phosphoreum]|uniref:electron transport complex subunit RsxC n=1 Tax=Photobacterium phosphoreum TaxID=659 RepID=UPI000D17F458|nr:electron transport complex subunit RsxC [Photobacterium phosphoreum]MCD9477962.1 electron transport complex subunit RsxC [Photobacterium phosphoreum]MCD9482755.1 electron transport complex subunit RsxC [Photobacterium phosphoreum]PSU38349.1 electron transport complex subunit RsxC [Photobacterium phosphoreum]
MLSIIEQIKQGKLWDFHGGIHPAENKALSSKQAIKAAGIPQELILPLKQHIGSRGDIIVNIGDYVLKGQPLTQGDIAMCVPIHAPSSGTITAIEQRTTAHPSGLTDLCIVIATDNQDTWCHATQYPDYQDRDPAELIEAIRLAGIAGLGGAGFPTARKLQGGLGNVDILIINAAECEPYITADDRLMQDYADEVIEGIRILRHIISPKLTLIGIEDNKPDAIKALEACVNEDDNIIIRVIPTKYPSGSSKQLVKLLTGREVPSQARSTSIGVIMQNVGTAFAIKRAIVNGEPLIERVVTLTGEAFKQRGNVFALLGTPIAYLLEKFDYKADKKYPRVIIGGSLMGFTLPHANVPITKITNCILTPKRKELPLHTYEMACIRCSACADACPASLLPQQLQWYAKDKNYDKCEEYNLSDCIECGACAYVCPSEIPLVQYYRQAKAEIWERKQDEMSAERARQRFEAKQQRMDRDKAERENRFAKAATDRRQHMATAGGDDAVAAAIARVKAKQAAATDTATPTIKPAVAAAIAKAKAKQAASVSEEAIPDNSEMAALRKQRKLQAREQKAAKHAELMQQQTVTEQPPEQASDKKDAVAAAVARAKARKAAQQAQSTTETQPAVDAKPATEVDTDVSVDPKKAAVAAAVARAKARKAAQQQPTAATEPTAEVNSDVANDPKKAAVAAAVARAKARKAAQQAQSSTETQPTVDAEPTTEVNTDVSVDPKKAAVAAAIARAKARKAAQQQPTAATEPTAEVNSDVANDPKKAAVAAAVARAKARKAAQQEQATAAAVARAKARKAAQQEQATAAAEPTVEVNTNVESDPKKAAVAAAVARAKARKAAQQAQSTTETQPAVDAEPTTEVNTNVAVDPKKAAVAAAVARAKARKAAQQAQSTTETQPAVDAKPTTEVDTDVAVDPKKAAVAAAVARAKARKAAQQANKVQPNIEEE